MKKLFSEDPIDISPDTDLGELRGIYNLDQRIRFTCVECGKLSIKRVESLKNFKCMICNLKQTCLEKYGFPSSAQSDIVKEKTKQTSLEKYGAPNYAQTKECREKHKQACLKKYGVENTFQSDIVKEKAKQTNLRKYGTEYASQSSAVKEKTKQTSLEKYGVDNYAQTKEYKEKSKQTCLEKYGVENTGQIPESKEKAKQTCLEKYGAESYFQTDECKEKTKQICLEKYGVSNYAKTKECREKSKQTCLEKYGVEYYFQTKEYRQKASRRYKHEDILFDSSWELAYFIYLVDHNIEFEFQCDSIEYYVEEKKHLYFPDFKIGDRLIEIKGPQFFTEDGKFVNPFDRSEKEDYKNQCKFKCMIDNNVEIVSDISEQMKYVEEKYGKDFIQSCRVK